MLSPGGTGGLSSNSSAMSRISTTPTPAQLQASSFDSRNGARVGKSSSVVDVRRSGAKTYVSICHEKKISIFRTLDPSIPATLLLVSRKDHRWLREKTVEVGYLRQISVLDDHEYQG